MADTTTAEVLDLLFDSDGVLEEQTVSTTTMPSLDFENLGRDLFGLLDDPCLLTGDVAHDDLFDQTFTLNTPDTEELFCSLTDNDKVLAQLSHHQPANHEIDHDYTPHRPPTQNITSGLSDSGISSPDSYNSGQFSPQLQASSGADSSEYQSDNGMQNSPGINTEQNSPLGGGIEDMDINQCLLQGEDLFNILTTDTNVSINLEMDQVSDDADSQIDDFDSFLASCKDENSSSSQGTDDNGGLPFTMMECNPNITQQSTNFTELRLSDEEKTLLAREGVVLPTNMPLTKEEERVLKAVRRKIRNKISAKESRKRKQGYVEGLEKRVKACTTHNLQLQKKVENLEKQNMTLVSQLKRLQTMITSTTAKQAQTGTCAMVLLLSFALLVVPSMNPFSGQRQPDIPGADKHVPVAGFSRSLLDADLPPPAGYSGPSVDTLAQPPTSELPVQPQKVNVPVPVPAHFLEAEPDVPKLANELDIDETNSTSDGQDIGEKVDDVVVVVAVPKGGDVKNELVEKEDVLLQFQPKGLGRGYVGTVDESKMKNDDL